MTCYFMTAKDAIPAPFPQCRHDPIPGKGWGAALYLFVEHIEAIQIRTDRVIEFPERTVGYMASRGNHFSDIVSRFGLKDENEVFGLIRQTIETTPPQDIVSEVRLSGWTGTNMNFLKYEPGELRVVVIEWPGPQPTYYVYNAFPSP